MNFVVIDVETANPDFSSICQVGIAEFRDGKHHGLWESLVNPEDYFDEMNIAVHGIEEHMVRQAPKWSAKAEDLMRKGQQIRIIGESDFQRLLGLRA